MTSTSYLESELQRKKRMIQEQRFIRRRRKKGRDVTYELYASKRTKLGVVMKKKGHSF